jgi:hypothetical protein
MDKKRIIKAFRAYFGASSWASVVLNVPRPHISAWLRDKKTVRKLDAEMPRLAALLTETKGACIGSARAQVNKIRKGR